MTDQADQPAQPSRPVKGKLGPLLLLALLISAIFVAWQIHEAFFAREPPAPHRPPSPRRKDWLPAVQAGGLPGELTGNPLVAEGIEAPPARQHCACGSHTEMTK